MHKNCMGFCQVIYGYRKPFDVTIYTYVYEWGVVDTHDLASHVVEFDPAVPVKTTAINCDVEGDVVSIHHVWKRSIISE